MKKFSLLFVIVCCALLVITGGYEPVSADNDTVTDIDGNVYKTVKIGNQVWTIENFRTTRLNDGTPIPLVSDSTIWKILNTPGFCYYDNMTDTEKVKKYGVLYNWFVIDTKKLAPKGWHVPTDDEWNTLENYLIANGYNWDGTTMNNKIAKSMAAKSDWQTSTEVGAIGNDLTKNNKSGFSALPGGCRLYNGKFFSIGFNGAWWSSSEISAIHAYHSNLTAGTIYLSRGPGVKMYGFSVRLIRDK